MSSLAGPFFAAALLLGVAGVLKVARPAPTRVALRSAGLPDRALTARAIGCGELAVAFYALIWAGRPGAVLVALAYTAFAGFCVRVIAATRGQGPCGCFGASGAPLTMLHVGVDVVVAGLAVLVAVDPLPGLFVVAGRTPLAGVPFLGFTVLLAWLVQVLLTALPALQTASRPPSGVAP